MDFYFEPKKVKIRVFLRIFLINSLMIEDFRSTVCSGIHFISFDDYLFFCLKYYFFYFQNVLGEAFNLTIERLLKENEEVPVKVEAAIALQMMLSSQVTTN
jgi:hypothetical protein